jgi:hypothetical protein
MLSARNNNRWLLVVVVVNCVAAAMVAIDGGNSGCCQWQQWWDWANGSDGSVVDCGGGWWQRQQWRLYNQLLQQWVPSLPSLPSPLPLPSLEQGLDGGVEGVPWHVSFVLATVVIVGAIFVSIHETMVPRTTAAATDEAVTPLSMAGKRWDTMTPSAWSNKNKNKNKHKNKNKNQ